MDLQKKMKSENVILGKRPQDRSIHRKIEEISKRRTLVQAVRDFPPGCGINEAEQKPLKILKRVHSDPVDTDGFSSFKQKVVGGNKASFVSRPVGKVKVWEPTCTKAGYDQKQKVTASIGTQRKNFDNVESNMRKMNLNGKDDKLVNSHPVENVKLKSIEQKELGRNKSYLDSKTSKVQFWDPNCLKEADAQKSEVGTAIVSRKDDVQREKIKEAMTLFDEVYGQLRQENRSKPNGKKISPYGVPIEACKIVKQRLKWKDPEKVLGPVCGVEIGDKFKYRSLLKMIGLHCQLQSGIDYTNFEGRNVAISIVDSHRYSNVTGSSDTLVYSGHGGHGGLGFNGRKLPAEDQKLKGGNMALKNSMDKKTPVRVIKKIEGFNEVFAYDGLYTVEDYTHDKNEQGNIVFKFHLKRIPGQPLLYKMLNGSR